LATPARVFPNHDALSFFSKRLNQFDTILHVLHCLPLPKYPSPRVLGIDDWAWRRGVRYGTILCDMERGNVIDLLPDSEAENVILAWMSDRQGQVNNRNERVVTVRAKGEA
jgi:hypothetical protein